jgi:hypothetical protein
MKEETKEKREQLKKLSAIAAELVKEGEAETINEGLILLYEKQGHTEIHSFKKWLEMGYAVRKGEKALLLWGQPKTGLNQEKEKEGEKDEFKFFPLAYVFSRKQVEPLKHLVK